MRKSLNKIPYLILSVTLFILISFIFVTGATTNKENNNDTKIKLVDLSYNEANSATDDVTTLTCYSSYRKYYNAEVGDDEKVTFTTVAKYSHRLYYQGITKFESEGFSKIRAFEDYFKDFYVYWYTQSGMLDKTKNNISEDRVNEIKNLYDEIVEFVYADKLDDAKTSVETLINKLYEDAVTLDNLGLYAEEIEKEDTSEKDIESGAAYYLTYNQYIKAENPNGDKTITYTIVAGQIKNLLYEGIERYKKYLSKEDEDIDYYTPFSNSYGFWYETSGFEKKTMAYISGARVTAVELQFSAMKTAARSGSSLENVQKEVDTLLEMLNTDAKKLDDLLGLSGSGSSGLTVATFVGCLTIMIREGLEAILILGAIVAYLIKTGNKKQTKFVYIGALVAIGASFLLAWLLTLFNLTGVPQEIIEGVTALIAVAVLIYVSNWMISKSESKAWTNYISSKVSTSSEKGKVFTLAFTSFLAVFREGAEVILFYQPLIASAKEMEYGWLAVFGGLGLGLVVVLAVFVVIRIFGIKIPLKPFFMATSILMAIMAVIFLGSGIWELFIDGGILANWGWPTGIISGLEWMAENEVLNFFGLYPTWWTIIPQLILLAILVLTFVLWIRKGKKENANSNSDTNNIDEDNNE